MDHGNIDIHTARGLQVLRQRIEAAKIPSSKLDETINIATWNIREFGKENRLTPSLHFIAEILNQFDLTAITEVRPRLHDLNKVINLLGPNWKAVFSDFNEDAAGNDERIAFVYDERAVTFTGLAAEADPPKKKVMISIDGGVEVEEYRSEIEWWRSPYMGSFRSANFDFVLLAAHIRYGNTVGERVEPIRKLAQWVKARREHPGVVDRDIIVLGDFNITSRRSNTFKAIVSEGLDVVPGLLKNDYGSNLKKDKRYDQILLCPDEKNTALYTDKDGNMSTPGGLLDFYCGDHKPLYPNRTMSKDKFTYQLSDHYPLWMQLNVWNEDLKLEQILNAGQGI